MYILFINSDGKCDIFFSTQFNNNSNKKNCPTHGFNLTQPNPCGLDWAYVMGWVEFFLTHHGGLGQKIPSTRPMHTPNHTLYFQSTLFYFLPLPFPPPSIQTCSKLCEITDFEFTVTICGF